jgi:hypothetical protein
MQQVGQITEIIEEILTNNDVENSADIAQDCAIKLVEASLQQLAAVLGTELETDEAGQVTLNLGALY